ncbi:MAG TPA: LuxR C-terminal-related transcriptional regulator [Acidimicrobiia bacterium]
MDEESTAGAENRSDRTDFLETKLIWPSAWPGFVPRPDLVSRLNRFIDRGLVLLSAPAGFGKTSLLAEWARDSDRPVAWLSLDSGDNDPVRFWRHVAASLDRAIPGSTGSAGDPSPATPPALEEWLTGLINAVTAQQHPVVVVLDDYHLVEARSVNASMLFLLDHLPPGLRVVLTTRSDPTLPLARFRVRGQLAELRANDLRFTSDEAQALLDVAVGPDVVMPEGAAAILNSRTEGWAAGLQLAGLSLQTASDVEGLIASFSGSHRFVLDFLTEEVLEHQPKTVSDFLMETSILERLSAGLCDATTGREDSQRMLEGLEKAGLFLVPLDNVRGWWRYHHLFADVLEARLKQERPARAVELHHNAAVWHHERGSIDETVRHALASADTTWAARLVEDHFNAWALRGETATVQRWLAALPTDVTQSRPRLSVAQAILAGVEGDVGAVEMWLDRAERSLTETDVEPYEPSGGRESSALTNVPAAIALERAYLSMLSGDVAAGATLANQALSHLGEGDTMQHSIARGHLAVASWCEGNLLEARDSFARLTGAWFASGEPTMVSWGCYVLGRMEQAQGDLEGAQSVYETTLAASVRSDGSYPPAAGAAFAGLAAVAYQRGNNQEALEHVRLGIPLCRRLAYIQPLADALADLAWIRLAAQDPAGSRQAIDEADAVAPGAQVVSLLNPVPAQRARLLLALGDVSSVTRWTQDNSLRPEDEPSYPREAEYLVLARLLIATNRPEEALSLLDKCYQAAELQKRVGSLIEILALQSLAWNSWGEKDRALDLLRQALVLSQPGGYVRVFADEGPAMWELFGRLVAARGDTADPEAQIDPAYLGQISQSADRGFDLKTELSSDRHLMIPLTSRELEVLSLLVYGATNRQIAEDLYIGVETVKKHVTHILDKLGASNRTEAAARGRELGLVP